MSRYDQIPDKPYAACEGCDTNFPAPADMKAHFKETMTGGKSHRARITNPTRAERIVNELDNLAEDALYEFVNKAQDLIEEGVTEEEITEAMRSVTADFADFWEQEIK